MGASKALIPSRLKAVVSLSKRHVRTDFTIMIVFPNFSEQPIFAESGKSVEIKADASHLKEMEVSGTKDNELMTKFRQNILNDTPPEAKKHAEDFIKTNIRIL